MKEFVANKIYIDEIPLRFLGMQLGTRMTVIRMKNNILFLHSPTILTPDLKKQLDELGRVSIIVCPNKLHHLYVNSYVDNYPNAKIYAAPGLSNIINPFFTEWTLPLSYKSIDLISLLFILRGVNCKVKL